MSIAATYSTEGALAIGLVADQWLLLTFWERDSGAAGRALSSLGADGCHGDAPFARAWCRHHTPQIKY